MHRLISHGNLKGLLSTFCGFVVLALVSPAVGAQKISYNRDIRPILSDTCFHCYGPDQKTRKGKFRLDVWEDAVTKGAIVSGKPAESERVNRILLQTKMT